MYPKNFDNYEPIPEILEDEYKRKIHLFHKLGFVLSDSVPIS